MALGATVLTAGLAPIAAHADAGGRLEGWPHYRTAPGAALTSADAFFTTTWVALLDESTGEYGPSQKLTWGNAIGEGPHSAVLAPGTYLLTTTSNHYFGDPLDFERDPDPVSGSRSIVFHDEREVVITADADTDLGAYVIGTRHWDVGRTAGSDRFATSAAISASTFEPGVQVAYVANGRNFPDALSGAAAGGALGGPVLLSESDGLPEVIRAELDRLDPRKIVLLGGPVVLGDAVAKQAAPYAPVVARYAGADRFSTSAVISANAFAGGAPVVFLANGYNFPDALSGAAVAGALGGPVLLTPAGYVPDVIRDELDRLNPDRIFVLGGQSAVDETIVQQARAYAPDVERLAGPDRFATSAAISRRFSGSGVPAAYLANGYNFPDALSGAAAAGAVGGPVLLTEANSRPEVVKDELIELDPDTVVVLGGSSVITDPLVAEVRRILTLFRPRPAT